MYQFLRMLLVARSSSDGIDTLRTSSFMNDVIFSYHGTYVCTTLTLRQPTLSEELTLH